MEFIDANFVPYTPSNWLSFDDVSLMPKFSSLKSRNDPKISLATKIGAFPLSNPIIASPMDTVCEASMCISLAKIGCLGILHRFYKKYGAEGKERFFNDIKEVHKNSGIVAFAVGLHPDDCDLVGEVLKLVPHALVCVDTAHGDQSAVYDAVRKISLRYAGQIQVMAGSVCTPLGIQLLIQAGAHIIRVGVGSGSLCSTRMVTGHGIPQLSAIMHARRTVYGLKKNVSIIADGGIRTSSDVVKCLAGGADGIMLGSLLAGTEESPGDILNQFGTKYESIDETVGNPKFKKYRGQASQEFMNDIGKTDVAPEGESALIPYKGSVVPIINNLLQGVRSGLTYSGAANIDELYNNATFVEISANSYIEGTPHLLRK